MSLKSEAYKPVSSINDHIVAATPDMLEPGESAEKPFDQVGAIIAFEQGDLDDDETIELFQNLIDTGLAWKLQGSYGRTAQALINAGHCNA